MGTWIKQKLGNLIDVNSDAIKKNYPHKDIEYVDISSVGTGRLDGVSLMSFANAPSRAKRVAQHGDTILSTVRPNRRSFLYVKNPPNNRVFSTGFAVLHPKRIDRRFLYYVISQQNFTDYLAKNAKGSAYPAVDEETICRAEIIAPDLPTQSRIASVLSAYDDLIENNEKRIKVLEEMAQRVYTEWFVRFKFPGHEKSRMVDSGTEYGQIPKGWEVRKLGDVVSFLEGPGLRNWQYRDNGLPFLNIRTIGNGDIDIEKCNYLDIEEVNQKYPHFLLKENDIVISSSGTLGRLAIIRKRHLPLCLNTSVIRFREIKKGLPIWFIKQYLLSAIFQNKIRSLASGSAQLNYGPSHLTTINLVMPSIGVLEAYNQKVSSLEIENSLLKDHITSLSKNRDLLIPQLVTGKWELK